MQINQLLNNKTRFYSKGYGFNEMCTAMRRLPNLRSVTILRGCQIVTRTKHLDKSFSATLQRSSAVDDSDIPSSRSLLLDAARAGLFPSTVQLGPGDWRLLQADDDELAKMKMALEAVRDCEIRITTG